MKTNRSVFIFFIITHSRGTKPTNQPNMPATVIQNVSDGLDSDDEQDVYLLYMTTGGIHVGGNSNTQDDAIECPAYVLPFSKFLTVLSETSRDNECRDPNSLYISSSYLTRGDLETVLEYARICYLYNGNKPFGITKRCTILARTKDNRTKMENEMVRFVSDKYNDGGIESIQQLVCAINYMDVHGLFDFLCYFISQKIKHMALQELRERR